jgi:alpha-ribazole phosphatase
MKIALIRHPAPEIAAGTCYGLLDMPLASEGVLDIERIIEALAGFPLAALWTSPARRCLQLADAIARHWKIGARPDARLQEMSFGAWEGLSWNDVPRAELDRWASDPLAFAAPGGESGANLIARVRAFHELITQEQRDCAIVSHGGPLKVLTRLLLAEEVDLLAPPTPVGSVRIINLTG